MSQPTFPVALDRKKCYAVRDGYFECMEKNKDDQEKCLQARKEFEGSCPKTWVKYFIRRRDYLLYSAKLGDKGFVPGKEEES